MSCWTELEGGMPGAQCLGWLGADGWCETRTNRARPKGAWTTSAWSLAGSRNDLRKREAWPIEKC